uniref:DUF192 domain-containing protein n=2 Tax=Thermorudis TaxID=1649508 RepID=A0A7C2W8S6_9BACT
MGRRAWPKEIRLIDQTRGVVIAERVRVARSVAQRFLGLMGRSGLQPGEGLLLDPCSSIHTFFMRFPIDVLYVGPDHIVRRVDHAMRPWRIGPLFTGAAYVVELAPGTARRTGVAVGDRVCCQPATAANRPESGS